MPVKLSIDAVRTMLLKTAAKVIRDIELGGTQGNIVTYTKEIGYHQGSDQFTAEINLGNTPEDTEIKLIPINADHSDMLKIAEAFCVDQLDCLIEVGEK